MRISVDMSLYPLQDNYTSFIHSFLDSLNAVQGLTVTTNAMSTQVHGEYDLVMDSIKHCLKVEFDKGAPFSLVTKILSVDREHSEWNKR
jgi:uncharacterized protein YqgV (UPF0045/DUF77 family)